MQQLGNTSLDLSNIEILSNKTTGLLLQLSQAGLDDIDFESFQMQVRADYRVVNTPVSRLGWLLSWQNSFSVCILYLIWPKLLRYFVSWTRSLFLLIWQTWQLSLMNLQTAPPQPWMWVWSDVDKSPNLPVNAWQRSDTNICRWLLFSTQDGAKADLRGYADNLRELDMGLLADMEEDKVCHCTVVPGGRCNGSGPFQ